MRRSNITVNAFSQRSVDAALQHIDDYIERYFDRVDKYLKAIAENGARAANVAFGGEVSVTVQGSFPSYSIVANGEQVCFLEFGAGTLTHDADRYASVMPFPVYPGSFSQSADGKGMYREGHEYWYYKDQRYEFIAPTQGMQRAYEAIVQTMKREARRIFN